MKLKDCTKVQLINIILKYFKEPKMSALWGCTKAELIVIARDCIANNKRE